jgi:mannose-6-phosphate isomerase-like protein (cupin superfamily)
MEAFELADLLAAQGKSGRLYHEFIRQESMSIGLYVLAAGGQDPQQPHREDEAYYIIRGKGTIRVADEDRPVQAGTTVFVAKSVEHRFHSIEEELHILVFFAPAESQ